MEKPLKIRLQTLSPVHIGCGDVYEPTSFVIDERRQVLVEFDQYKMINLLNQEEKAELTDVCMGDDLLKIFKFIKKSYKPDISGREVEIVPALLKQYKKILSMSRFDKKTVINQFEIGRTAYNTSNHTPYIPGSSLKGALRTAYLSSKAKEKGVKKYWEMPGKRIGNRLPRELEEDLLNGKFQTDPFSLLKISDLKAVNDVSTKIVYAVNKKKKLSKFDAKGPFQILETIQDGGIFEGIINIEKPERGSKISMPVNKEMILKSLDYFYKSICKDEDEVLSNIDASSMVLNTVDSRFKETIGVSTFLVRLGRHAGAESITIEGNRRIKIMQGRGSPPKFEDKATTTWLASDSPNPNHNRDLLPFGWAIISIGDQELVESTICHDTQTEQEGMDNMMSKLVGRWGHKNRRKT